MRQYTDDEILQGIEQSDSHVIHYIYQRYLPLWVSVLNKMGGNPSDARDIFQEALMAVFIRLRKPEAFALTVAFQTYLMAICRRQWAYRRRSQSKMQPMEEEWKILQEDGQIVTALERSEKYRFYRRHLDQLGGRCPEILRLHFQKLNNEAIGKQLGLSVAYVKKRKFLCKQVLKEAIRKDPGFDQY